MPSIRGHKVIIIGGSSGIGYGVAQKAVEEGAEVIVASSNIDKVNKAVKSLKEVDSKAIVHGEVIDMFQENVEDALDKLFSKFAPLDHVVYTANRVDFTTANWGLENVTEKDVWHSARTRLWTTFAVSKMVQKYVKQHYTSSYTTTTGSAYLRPIPKLPLAGTFCAAQNGFTLSVAAELAPIRVNVVSPGAVDTPIFGETPEQRQIFLGPAAERSPLKKYGSVEETAEAYIYLLKNSNTTATVVDTSSGMALPTA
uniref:ARAD1C40722p n=1 Tax=Blastobotrys adeninivorans TaxID=409370 RepID=A0A060T404_BLAAD